MVNPWPVARPASLREWLSIWFLARKCPFLSTLAPWTANQSVKTTTMAKKAALIIVKRKVSASSAEDSYSYTGRPSAAFYTWTSARRS